MSRVSVVRMAIFYKCRDVSTALRVWGRAYIFFEECGSLENFCKDCAEHLARPTVVTRV